MISRNFQAPAKVNLCLHIAGRRPDGYHELQMIMQKVSLYDDLTISLLDNEQLTVVCNDVSLVAGEVNIVERAARAMLGYCSQPCGVEITLKKNIPVAAGLGGGSSDAAMVLLALNQMLDLQLDENNLHDEALQLGADVPFFLQDQCVWATGIGDRFVSITHMPKFYLVLVNPGVGVSTALVYGAISAEYYSNCLMADGFDDVQQLCAQLHNDLEPVAIGLCPVIEEAKSTLRDCGALGVLMSGSGATVFGVFSDNGEAEAAAECVRRERGWWAMAVSPV